MDNDPEKQAVKGSVEWLALFFTWLQSSYVPHNIANQSTLGMRNYYIYSN